MQITDGDFKKIMEHTRDALLKQLIPAKYENDYPAEVIPKALLLSLPNLITLKDFLDATGEKKERAKTAPAADDKGFAEFWKNYPATPTFRHKGMNFRGSRTLRSNYGPCQNLYLKALDERPDITPELMLKALQIQLTMAKDESVDKGVNKLDHWNGLEVYLRQGKFEPFLEMAAEDDQPLQADRDFSATTGNSTGGYRYSQDENSNSA